MRSTRREILRTLGLSAAMSPFLPILNQEAEAQLGGEFPTRLLLMFTGNGSVPSRYWPEGGETDFTFPEGVITEALAPHRAKLIFPQGLNRVATGPGGHESATVPTWNCASRVGNSGRRFGGHSTMATVDQIIANEIPMESPFKSLEFGVMSNAKGANPDLLTVMCYAGNNDPITPQSNPRAMFDQLMLGTADEPAIPQPALEEIRALRQSTLDLVRNELNSLSPKIGYDDRIKVQQHVEGLAGIERRLQQIPTEVPTLTPTFPEDMPESGNPLEDYLQDDANFPAILETQNQLAVAALAARRTRVASLMWGRSFSQVRHRWVGVEDEHHTLSHLNGEDNVDKKYRIERWFMERMAEFLTRLDSVPEGNGTLLDNMMLIYTNELATGPSHNPNDPDGRGTIALVAGSAGGRLRTGRFLDRNRLDGYDWANLLTTAAQVMGATSVQRIGDMGNEGDLGELYV